MEEENHLNPPPKNHKTQEYTTNKPFNPPTQQGNSNSSKTLVYTLLTIVLLSIAFLIFGLVVLRTRSPTLRLSNVIVKDLRHTPSSLNTTLLADLTLRNTNFGRFKFQGAAASVFYGNTSVGAATIYAGDVGGRGRRVIVATVEVIVLAAANTDSSMNISKDIESNLVKVRGVAELRGEVRVLKMVSRHRIAFMNCSLDLNLTSQGVQGLSCR